VAGIHTDWNGKHFHVVKSSCETVFDVIYMLWKLSNYKGVGFDDWWCSFQFQTFKDFVFTATTRGESWDRNVESLFRPHTRPDDTWQCTDKNLSIVWISIDSLMTWHDLIQENYHRLCVCICEGKNPSFFLWAKLDLIPNTVAIVVRWNNWRSNI